MEVNGLKNSKVIVSGSNGHEVPRRIDGDPRRSFGYRYFDAVEHVRLPRFQHVGLGGSRRPNFLRDLLWVPAHVECQDGQQGEVYLPTLYPGSESDESAHVRLGRITEWVNLGEGLVGGLGLKTFVIGDAETSLLEMSELEIAG